MHASNLQNLTVILIDGWKNFLNNTKTVVTLLHNAEGPSLFLEAWDISAESETDDTLSKLIEEAKKKYNTKLYAAVSDNISNMLKMGRSVDLWHSNCSSHTGNLLANDIVPKRLNENVVKVNKEFKLVDLEAALLKESGNKVHLPIDVR